ncbi:hypothetical protein COU60_05335 [Candidatus Pacearchaeota archaeon CG10_big_fil_rev_8_21_14_0_10_34_76]|nr:MAG: hypothetical protein COU60_05335 [Candidatus Pacearchaeota archaeon CG10_big_fil_rev_8_21_14_0_10_34_76]
MRKSLYNETSAEDTIPSTHEKRNKTSAEDTITHEKRRSSGLIKKIGGLAILTASATLIGYATFQNNKISNSPESKDIEESITERNDYSGKVMGPLTGLDVETGLLNYKRMDFLFEETAQEEKRLGHQLPSDFIVINNFRDLRKLPYEINPFERTKNIDRETYFSLLKEGKVPIIGITSPEGREKLELDPEAQDFIAEYIPAKIMLLEVPKSLFNTTDPWSYLGENSSNIKHYILKPKNPEEKLDK